jgi:hypothetical protein
MARFFNTTGPCDPRDHYTLPAERRMPDLLPFIERKQYFVVHAPRQVGKTTAMMAFAARLRERGSVAVWATLEQTQEVEDVETATMTWLRALEAAGRALPEVERPPSAAGFDDHPGPDRLRAYLAMWAASLDAPLVLMLDEADVVRGPALISLLRQLRAGFMQRGVGRFPTSVGLIGMRDLRDYVTESKGGAPVNPGSPFNIKAGSFTIRNFTAEEVVELLAQHTAETSQPFTQAALAELFRLTQGQPFLVNWLADHCVTYLVTDRSVPVDLADVTTARERLVLSRTTHLDSLGQRLRDARVAPVVQAALLGDGFIDYAHDDWQYVVDLGLLRKGPAGAEPANPLYAEVLGRQVSYTLQENLNAPQWRWATPDGRLDFPALMREFLAWWRENADILPQQAPGYPEAVPHLSLMAFLQRVVNGGGHVEREFAAGRGALDLLVSYGPDRFAVEVKRVRERDGLERVREAGIAQTLRYLDTVGLSEGWLVLFDVRAGRSWEERLWAETVEQDGRLVHLRGA